MPTQFTTNRFPLGRSLVSLSALYLLLAVSGQAHAQDVSVVFTPNTMTAPAGSTVNYSALFTNLTSNDLFINGVTVTATDPNFLGVGFFNGNGIGNGTFELTANQSLTVNNVVSLVLNSTPPGTYDLEADFTGTGSSNPNPVLGSGTLHIIVAGAPTPEFGSLWSLGGLLAVGGAGWWRQQRRSRTGGAQEPSAAS